jgi:hypothetical protein
VTANKDDSQKPKLSKLMPQFQEEMAFIRANGDAKYGEDDWKRGMPFSKLVDSAQRHINQIKQGIRWDGGIGGDGREHSAHVATCMEMLHHYQNIRVYGEFDDLDPSRFETEVDGLAQEMATHLESANNVGYSPLDRLQNRINKWADSVFPERTAEDALKKLIMEEIPELLTSDRADDPLEWADVFILVLDCMKLKNIDPILVSNIKMGVNEKRTWERNPLTGLMNHVKEDNHCLRCGKAVDGRFGFCVDSTCPNGEQS